MKAENSQDLQDKAEVLIALAAQQNEAVEEPPSPEELADFFANSRRFSKQRQEQILAYLDSNPQAYERWIQQGKRTEQPSRAPFSFMMAPYAIAAVVVLLLMIGVSLLWRSQAFELDQAIDRAYQVAILSDNPESFRQAMTSLTDTLQGTERPLSFSSSGQSSLLAQTFMLGLSHDLQALDQEPSGSDLLAGAQQEDYQLGRWHTLLWTVSQQNEALSPSFWQEQLNILNHLQTHYAKRAKETNTAEVRAVVLQLERMQAILEKLRENSQVGKSYQQLQQVLSALRYGLIPLS